MAPGNRTKGQINVTPLIDVLLVLLILFMVITPTRPVGLEARVPQLPSEASEPYTPDLTVVLEIDKDLAIRINSELTEISQVGARLTDIFRTRTVKALFVKADSGIEFGHVANAIDIAKGAGIDTIGLLGAEFRTR